MVRMLFRSALPILLWAIGLATSAQGNVDVLRDADDKAQQQWEGTRARPNGVAPADTNRIYRINDLERMPEFPGGQRAMYAYIAGNFQYTDTARTASAGGRIFVEFVVERSGEVDRVRLLRGFNTALSEEALRVISAMPSWTPGTYYGGIVVACRMVVPIHCQPK